MMLRLSLVAACALCGSSALRVGARARSSPRMALTDQEERVAVAMEIKPAKSSSARAQGLALALDEQRQRWHVLPVQRITRAHKVACKQAQLGQARCDSEITVPQSSLELSTSHVSAAGQCRAERWQKARLGSVISSLLFKCAARTAGTDAPNRDASRSIGTPGM